MQSRVTNLYVDSDVHVPYMTAAMSMGQKKHKLCLHQLTVMMITVTTLNTDLN